VLTKNAATTAQKHKAYVYQFFWDGDKKLLSAWRPWDFGTGTPVTAAYESGSLMILMERPDGVFLEKMDLSPEAVSTNQDHPIYLDRQVSVTGTYNSGTNRTTFSLGYAPDASTLQIIRGKGSRPPRVGSTRSATSSPERPSRSPATSTSARPPSARSSRRRSSPRGSSRWIGRTARSAPAGSSSTPSR
jgi:hypothetical protein